MGMNYKQKMSIGDQPFDTPYQELYFYDGSNNLEYLCRAQPGRTQTENKWQITKFTYNGSNFITHKAFANHNNGFVWRVDQRTSYDYTIS